MFFIHLHKIMREKCSNVGVNNILLVLILYKVEMENKGLLGHFISVLLNEIAHEYLLTSFQPNSFKFSYACSFIT